MNLLDNMNTKFAVMAWSFLSAIILNDSFVFGILPAEYFGYRPIVYGFIGNLLYSLIMLFAEWRNMAEDSPGHREMNRYGYMILFAQPFGAAFFSFVLTAVVRTNVEINEGMSVLIGICSGLFFVYLATPDFVKEVWNRYVKKKIIGNGNDR